MGSQTSSAPSMTRSGPAWPGCKKYSPTWPAQSAQLDAGSQLRRQPPPRGPRRPPRWPTRRAAAPGSPKRCRRESKHLLAQIRSDRTIRRALPRPHPGPARSFAATMPEIAGDDDDRVGCHRRVRGSARASRFDRHLARPFAEAIDIPQAADTHWRRHRSAFCRRGGPPS